MVTVRNKRNGAQSEMTEAEWKELQANPNYTGLFVEVKPKTVAEPEEVKQLKERKAGAKKAVAVEPEVAQQTEASETVNEDNGK